jgi:hypothetical protein
MRMQNFDKLHTKLVEQIKENNLLAIKSYIKQYNVKNVASIYSYEVDAAGT